MKIAHAITWSQNLNANALAQRSLAAYPDELEPKADRSAMRAKHSAALKYLGSRWLLAEQVKRVA